MHLGHLSIHLEYSLHINIYFFSCKFKIGKKARIGLAVENNQHNNALCIEITMARSSSFSSHVHSPWNNYFSCGIYTHNVQCSFQTPWRTFASQKRFWLCPIHSNQPNEFTHFTGVTFIPVQVLIWLVWGFLILYTFINDGHNFYDSWTTLGLLMQKIIHGDPQVLYSVNHFTVSTMPSS